MLFNEFDEAFEGESAIGLRHILATSFVYYDWYFVLAAPVGGFRSLVKPSTEIHLGDPFVFYDNAGDSSYVAVAISSGSGSDGGGETILV
jgi:hypothetical protein